MDAGHLALQRVGVVLGDGELRARAHAHAARREVCLLYTSDAADERSSVDLGGRRIIKKKKSEQLDERRDRDTE